MATKPDLQWDVGNLTPAWPRTRDTAYLIDRLARLPVELTAADADGLVLEVACGEATRATALARSGLAVTALEPSPAMLDRARDRLTATGARVTLVRGIAETLPFADGRFARVLCESSLDHFADPERAIAEMARVLRPGGRLVLGVTNYGSPTIRASRGLYRLARAAGWVAPGRRLFWDTPVPHEHTREWTWDALLAAGARHLELVLARGVSIGWQLPVWHEVVNALPERLAVAALHRLDRLAYRVPRLGDFVLTVWRRPA